MSDITPEVAPSVAVAAHLERAEFFRERGRSEEAEREVRLARGVDPLGPTCVARATWLERAGRVEEAVVELEGLLAAGTLNLEPALFLDAGDVLVSMLRRAGRDSEADRLLQRLTRVANEAGLVNGRLLIALAESAAHATAPAGSPASPSEPERLLLGALRIAEDDAEVARALAQLGRLYLREHRHDGALAALWRAYRMQVDLRHEEAAATVLGDLGEVCWRLGRTRPAFRAWRTAVLRLERLGATRQAAEVRGRLETATRVLEVRDRDPERN